MKGSDIILKIGDYVRISPGSIYFNQEKKYGKAGKVVSIDDAEDVIWYSVKFSRGQDGYQEEGLIKLTKFDWLSRRIDEK